MEEVEIIFDARPPPLVSHHRRHRGRNLAPPPPSSLAAPLTAAAAGLCVAVAAPPATKWCRGWPPFLVEAQQKLEWCGAMMAARWRNDGGSLAQGCQSGGSGTDRAGIVLWAAGSGAADPEPARPDLVGDDPQV
jgi:hypothetical protein